jgi:hypothetical protein
MTLLFTRNVTKISEHLIDEYELNEISPDNIVQDEVILMKANDMVTIGKIDILHYRTPQFRYEHIILESYKVFTRTYEPVDISWDGYSILPTVELLIPGAKFYQ